MTTAIMFLASLVVAHGGGAVQANQGDDPKAVAFLKQTMDVYQAMPALKLRCAITSRNSVDPKPDVIERTITYGRPSWFSVSSIHSWGTSESVSDGQTLLELQKTWTKHPKPNDRTAWVSHAPPSIWELPSSAQLNNPTISGSPIYAIFGGSANYAKLVDSNNGSVKFGAEKRAPGGEMARVVQFYGQELYGNVRILIGEKSHHVFRISYDEVPLIAMMAQMTTPEFRDTFKELARDSATNVEKRGAAIMLSSMDEMQKREAKGVKLSFSIVERYGDLRVLKMIDTTLFDTRTPKGAVRGIVAPPATVAGQTTSI